MKIKLIKVVYFIIISMFVGIYSNTNATEDCPNGGTPQQEELGKLLLKTNYHAISCRYLGQPYNRMGNQAHPGIDYSAPAGTPIYAPVTAEYKLSSTEMLGKASYVILPNGKRLFFLHMRNLVLGYREKGEEIGLTYDDHVHVELRVGYSGTYLVGGESCGGTCTLQQIEEMTDDPSTILDVVGAAVGALTPAVADAADRAAQEGILQGVFVEAVPLYSRIAKQEMRHNREIIPKGYPIGETIGSIRPGRLAFVHEVYQNDTESRFTLLVSSTDGAAGYTTATFFKPTLGLGGRGRILFLHLQAPYEFEGDSNAIRKAAALYKAYHSEHPDSPYAAEALIFTARLQCLLWDTEAAAGPMPEDTARALGAAMLQTLAEISRNPFCDSLCDETIRGARRFVPTGARKGPSPFATQALHRALAELGRHVPSSFSRP
ncbi:MAG: hypothetical protein H5U10_17355 [Desulfacinum sp.]|nr:hypothetical protein [Desulfacinum sp.]